MNSHARLEPLTAKGPSDLERSFARLAEGLAKSSIEARIRAQILGCPEARTWTINAGDGRCDERGGGERPELEIITQAETWWEIATGDLSPIDAFLGGRMRVRGDIEIGKDILRQLSNDGGTCDPCGG